MHVLLLLHLCVRMSRKKRKEKKREEEGEGITDVRLCVDNAIVLVDAGQEPVLIFFYCNGVLSEE
jgi:hypothetical protein